MMLGIRQFANRCTGRTTRCGLWAIALSVAAWLAMASVAVAEESSILQLFQGIRGGSDTTQSDTSEAATTVSNGSTSSPNSGNSASGSANHAATNGNGQAMPVPPAGEPGAWRPVQRGGGSTVQGPNGEELPSPRVEGTLPLSGWDSPGNIEFHEEQGGDRISLIVRDASLSSVLALIAQEKNLNIVAANDIDATISITLRNVPIEEALTAILSVANYTWVCKNDIILVTSITGAAQLPASVQGRQIQVFQLDFASAIEVSESVTGFLSPIGKVTTSLSDKGNNRRTRELVIVEDLPDSVARIAAYIDCIDVPPRQVEIEAHVLQVTLKDVNRNGVNFDAMFQVAGADVNIGTTGFANEEAPQAFLATINGTDLNAVIELLELTTDTKTLGSPKLLVVNEQEARMQVGQQLGFSVTTTTETSTMESVQFLDVGVVLTMTPRITRDGRVLMHIRPEVSSGRVNPDTGLPEEETTFLETDAILNDGQGMVLGGLIKEVDQTLQQKVPVIGDVWGIGKFFQRSEVTKERVEIIIAIVPRVQPYDPKWYAYEQGELAKAGTQLYKGPLCRTHRPWEAVLPDNDRVSRPWWPPGAPPHDYRPRLGPNSQYFTPPHPKPVQDFPYSNCEPIRDAPYQWQGQPGSYEVQSGQPMPEEALPAPQEALPAAPLPGSPWRPVEGPVREPGPPTLPLPGSPWQPVESGNQP